MTEGAVVLHSGGQDSTTCLAWAIRKWGKENVKTVSFMYGQRHGVELHQADIIRKKFGLEPTALLPVDALSMLGGAALTNRRIDVAADATGSGNVFAEAHGLPSTFVPGRNLLFFTLAAAYGAQFGIYNLVTGVCEADDAGYPDCRASFVDAAERALREALDEREVAIWAPLLTRTKADTFKLAEDLDVLDTILEDTHTCYEGVRDIRDRHPWGYGCGECPACLERAKGYQEFRGNA